MSHGFGEKRVFKIQTAMQFAYSMQALIDSIRRGELPNLKTDAENAGEALKISRSSPSRKSPVFFLYKLASISPISNHDWLFVQQTRKPVQQVQDKLWIPLCLRCVHSKWNTVGAIDLGREHRRLTKDSHAPFTNRQH